MVYAWVLLPVTELFLKPDEHNLEAAEEELAKKNRLYVYMLYIIFHFLPWGQRRRAITGAVFLNGWRFSWSKFKVEPGLDFIAVEMFNGSKKYIAIRKPV